MEADKISSIQKILDKLETIEQKEYLESVKVKYLTMPIHMYIKLPLNEKKKYILNTINTHYHELSVQSRKYILLLTQTINMNKANLAFLEDNINMMLNYEKKMKQDKMINDKLAWLKTFQIKKEDRFTIEECKQLCKIFAAEENNQFIYNQTNELNYALKEEYRCTWFKQIQNWKEKYKQIKNEFKLFKMKANQNFPNYTFQIKVKEWMHQLLKEVSKVKQCIYYGKKWKAYGILSCLKSKILKLNYKIAPTYNLETWYNVEILKEQMMTSTLQNSQAIKEALEVHEMEKELNIKQELTNMETPELHRKLNITTKEAKLEDEESIEEIEDDEWNKYPNEEESPDITTKSDPNPFENFKQNKASNG